MSSEREKQMMGDVENGASTKSSDGKEGRRGLGWRKKEKEPEGKAAKVSPKKSTNDSFEARRSTRVNAKYSQSDGDTWQETLAVCEAKDNKLVIRSYYTNTRTKQRAWDEPPSGASRVLPATEEMRRMANIQLLEMQIVTGHVPDAGAAPEEGRPKKKKGGFFRRGKAKDDAKKSAEQRKIEYKPESFLSQSKKEKKRDESLDPQLQQAIALSVRETTHEGSEETDNEEEEPVIRSEITYRDDEEAMAMVMALSLSEADGRSNAGAGPADALTEEEMFHRAVKESQSGMVAKAPPPMEDENFLGIDDSPSTSDRKLPTKSDSVSTEDWMNQKMPAKPTSTTTNELAEREEELLQQALRESLHEVHGGDAHVAEEWAVPNAAEAPRKRGGVKGFVRRLSSNKGLKEDAGVV